MLRDTRTRPVDSRFPAGEKTCHRRDPRSRRPRRKDPLVERRNSLDRETVRRDYLGKNRPRDESIDARAQQGFDLRAFCTEYQARKSPRNEATKKRDGYCRPGTKVPRNIGPLTEDARRDLLEILRRAGGAASGGGREAPPQHHARQPDHVRGGAQGAPPGSSACRAGHGEQERAPPATGRGGGGGGDGGGGGGVESQLGVSPGAELLHASVLRQQHAPRDLDAQREALFARWAANLPPAMHTDGRQFAESSIVESNYFLTNDVGFIARAQRLGASVTACWPSDLPFVP